MPTVTPKVPARIRRRIRIAYFCVHISCAVIGIVILGLAYLSQKAEQDRLQFLNLNPSITKALSILFYVVGGSILLTTGIGVLGMLLGNGYLVIIYSMLMAVICLTAVAGAGSALDQQGEAVRKEMRTLIGNYKDNQNRDIGMNRKVDTFQTTYKCCGIDSYSNWQDVEYGRTSLKLPTSCCKVIPGQKFDPFCGELCLPDHVNLTRVINTDGCFPKLFSNLRLTIIILGFFGLLTFLLTGFTFVLTCYLIISKKMDTR